MAFNVQEFLSSLKTEFNIPDEKIPKEAVDGWKAGSDYNREFNKLKKEHAERMAEEDDFHSRLLSAEDKLVLMRDYEAKFGPAENWSDALQNAITSQHPGLTASDQQGFTLAQVQEIVSTEVGKVRSEVQNIGRGSAIMIDFMSTAPDRWKDFYGTKFPKDDFAKFFKTAGTQDPFLAFELFEKPFAQKHLEDKHKADLDTAKREGYQSAMSKHGITESPVGQAQSGLFLQGVKPPEIDTVTGQVKPDTTPAPSHEEQKSRVGGAYQKALDAANSGKVPGATPGI